MSLIISQRRRVKTGFDNIFIPEFADWGFNEGNYWDLNTPGEMINKNQGGLFQSAMLANPVPSNTPYIVTFKPVGGLFVRISLLHDTNYYNSNSILDGKYRRFIYGKAAGTDASRLDWYRYYNNTSSEVKVQNISIYDANNSIFYMERKSDNTMEYGHIPDTVTGIENRVKLGYFYDSVGALEISPYAAYLSWYCYTTSTTKISDIKIYT